jgi:sugar-specific transcriptional regulator TrmB
VYTVEMIEKFLTDLGFSEKEIEVYLKLLSVEHATVTELARMTSINRTTLYPILEQLLEKKIVLEVEKGKKARFQAEPPERLATYIQNEKTKLEEQEKLLDEVIPRLKSVSLQTGEKPIVKIFEGREGIIKSTEETFESTDNEKIVYLIYNKDQIDAAFSEKEKKGARNPRLEKGIKAVSIYKKTGEDLLSDEMSERHRIKNEAYPITCDINIYDDRVRIHTMGESLNAIYIKNKDVADTLRTLFKLAIEGLK